MKRALWIILGLAFVLSLSSESSALDRKKLRWARNSPIIDSIVVEGNHYFSDGDIRKQMYSKERSFLGWLKGDRRTRVQRETLGRDTLEIKYMYLLEGFFDISVTEEFEVLEPDSNALVRVKIDEGRQRKFGYFEMTGDYPKEIGLPLHYIASKIDVNKPLNYFKLRQTIFDMRTVFANRGYPYAGITYESIPESSYDSTGIRFLIYSDSLVHFGNVRIEGVNNFPPYTARRELKIKPDKIYRRADILDSQTRLFESSYFTTFQIQQAETNGNRLRPDFVVRVRERKPYYISFQTGARQSEERDLVWDFSTGFGMRNFFRSRRLELLTDYSFGVGADSRLLVHRYRLRFTEPWFLGIRMPLSLTAEFDPKLKDPTQDFDKQAWVIGASTIKRFGPKVKLTLGFEYQSVDISGVPADEILEIKRQTGNSARRKLYAEIRRDSRDNLFIPSRGSVTQLSGEYFGGFLSGDENFFRIQTSWSRYQIVWPGWIGALRLKAGWAEEFGESDFVPSDELLYVGGANTIRGFRENTLGPLLEDGDPKGARVVLVMNQEFRWKTIQIFNKLPFLSDLFKSLPLWQSVFFDMGNGFDRSSDISWDNLAFSYGTGVQLASPAGPIRIDYARRIPTSKIDFASRIHFTILYAF